MHSSRVLSLLLLGAAACAPSEPVRRELDPSLFKREGPGLPRLDNGDGTWSYDLDPSFDPDALVEAFPITWRYVRQERYSIDPAPPYSTLSYTHEIKPVLTPAESLMRVEYHDAEGRIWQPAYVDPVVDTKDYGPAEPVLEDSAEVVLAEDEVPEPQPGDVLTWTPTTWNNLDCNGDSDNDTFIWDTDDRSIISSPSAPRQRTAVRILIPGGRGSGVMLRDEFLLTAAHVVHDSNFNNIPAEDIDIYLDWASESQLGIAGTMHWAGWDGDTGDDWTAVHLTSAWTNDPGDMDLSNASDSTLDSVGANFHRLGFPKYLNSCNTTNNNSLVHSSNNEITAHPSDQVRWKGDSSGGMSGGPLYYCPDGDVTACGANDVGFVIGVGAGWSDYFNRITAARAAAYKTDVVNWMDSF